MNLLMLSTDDRVFERGSEVRNRMQALSGRFDSLAVMVFTRSRRQIEHEGRLRLYPLTAAFTVRSFFAAIVLGSRILKGMGPHAVITSQDAFTNVAAFALKRRFGLALQVQIHTDFLAPAFRRESFKNRIRYFLYRWSVRRADCIRVVSQRIKDSLNSEILNLKSEIAVLPVFVDARKIAGAAPAFNLLEQHAGYHPIVLWVGRLTCEKNPDLALEVMAGFVKEFPKSLLVMVGDGPERESLQLKVRSSKLNESVRFEGWQRDAASYYKSADALLVTSRYEGYGRMLVEAAAAGLPIVATDVGIIGEVLKPGESVLTFRSPAEGAAALARLFREPGLADRLRANARRAVLSQATDFQIYLRAYRAALEHCGRSARS